MPSFTGSYNPTVGPLTQLRILPVADSSGQPPDLSSLKMFTALIDTGASTTCLSQRVVQDVGLSPIGMVQMVGATGQKAMRQFAFSVGFLHGQHQNPDGTINGQVAFMTTRGMEFDAGGSTFDVLLGRDVLCQGVFSLSFDGHWLFSF